MHPNKRSHGDAATRAALAARAGDPHAFEALVRTTQPTIWRLHAHLVTPGHADDLTQETYLRAVQALPGYRGQASATTWLLAIARRVAADHHRARSRQPPTTQISPDTAAVRAPTHPDLAEAATVRHLIAQLEPDRRTAFVLTQLLGLPYAEAAHIAGCPIGTIRSRVARARDDLITAMSDQPARPAQVE